MGPTSTLFEWLLDGAPGAASPAEVVARLALETRAAGIPVDRVAVFVTTMYLSQGTSEQSQMQMQAAARVGS